MLQITSDHVIERPKPEIPRPEMIISGGQTGADQAALQTAVLLGIRTGGYAPKGFATESGGASWLGERYGLVETSTVRPSKSTQMNIELADGSVWIGNAPSPGSKATVNASLKVQKPIIFNPEPHELRAWITRHNIKILNVAGNRASRNPVIQQQVVALLTAAFGDPAT